MCTVTYVPLRQGYVLTSNRDEAQYRGTLPPLKMDLGHTVITCPKDTEAGGTWIGHDDKGNTLCLLNGANENFEPQPHYTHSRGHIILEYFRYGFKEAFWNAYPLANSAPFTLVSVRFKPHKLMVIKWDGLHLHKQNLEVNEPYIWSSATLYDSEQRRVRQDWWNKWCQDKNKMQPADAWAFHSSHHGDNLTYDILMDRHNGIKTVSITQIQANDNICTMCYEDLVNPQLSIKKKLLFNNVKV